MDDILRSQIALERLATAAERIATALEEMNKRNPTPKLTDPDKPKALGTDQW